MRIIFICTRSITFNTFLKSQADFFLEKGENVLVACSDNEKLDFTNEYSYKINFPNKIIDLFNIINFIKIYRQIKLLVRNNPSDIYYIHTPLASYIFRLFTYFKNIKIIYFVHGFRFTPQTNYLKNILFKTIETVLSYNTDTFITINNHDFKYAKYNLNKKNSCYKIQGVGLNIKKIKFKKHNNIKNNIKKILVIAAYKKDKGYLELLKIAELMKNKKIKIVCYGYGNYLYFNSLKIKRNLKNISFNKFDINLKNRIKNFDILLHLSKREGLPVSIMQSLSEGLPVICYNIRGNNDLIKDKLNGYFIKSFKDVPNKINYLTLENNIFNKMRLNASLTIDENFSQKNINQKIYDIIKKNNK